MSALRRVPARVSPHSLLVLVAATFVLADSVRKVPAPTRRDWLVDAVNTPVLLTQWHSDNNRTIRTTGLPSYQRTS